ncbi:hypothetical protein JCM10212_003208 [Sporobolomyces blumeae]
MTRLLIQLPRIARSGCPVVARLPTRPFSTSSSRLNATPDWENLIGGRAGVERKRVLFEQKYETALKAKAEREGVSIDQLKDRVKALEKAKEDERRDAIKAPAGPVEAGSVGTRQAGSEGEPSADVVRPLPSSTQEKPTSPPQPYKKGDSPVKPLHDIMDLSKVHDLTSGALSQLWTTYHQAKGFLSAAIPTETYLRMISSARKYPLFVLPLQRDVVGEAPDGTQTEQAVEMYLLEWSLLPQPANVTEPVPAPSTVLFTPLAEYKSRQEFAQPYLILTHYTDLSASHDVVLMRGEITPNVALNDTDAQVLAVRMQLFYNDKAEKGEVDLERRELLRIFHEEPDKFEWQRLIKAGEISEGK